MKRIILGVAVLVAVVATAGCSDKDSRFWASVIDSIFSSPDYHYTTRCHSYVDRRGRVRRECWRERHYHRRRNPRFEAMPMNPIDGVLSDENSILFLSNKFSMSYDSANKLVLALEKARDEENFDALFDLGLTKEDFEFISQGKMIYTNSIEKFATALDMDFKAATALLEQFVAEVQKNLNE